MRNNNEEASVKMLECALQGDVSGMLEAHKNGGDLHYKDARGRNPIIELAKLRRPESPNVGYGWKILEIANTLDKTILTITDNGGGTACTWLAYTGNFRGALDIASAYPETAEHFCNYGSSVTTLLAQYLIGSMAYLAPRQMARYNPKVLAQPVIAALWKNKNLDDAQKASIEESLRKAGFTQ